MRKIFATLLISLFILVSSESYSQGIELREFNSWEEVLEAAKDEDKPDFAEIYTDWCSWCKKLEKDVFTAESVGKFYNDNFISINNVLVKERGTDHILSSFTLTVVKSKDTTTEKKEIHWKKSRNQWYIIKEMNKKL